MNSTSHPSYSSLDAKPLGGLGLCLGVFIVFLVVTYVSYMCKRARDEATRTTHIRHSLDMATFGFQENGLDESNLSSYPQVTYSDSKAAASACAICLADYAAGDLLRLLPDCGHLFHLKCVDPWLLRRSSCPLCRFSPSPAPLGLYPA